MTVVVLAIGVAWGAVLMFAFGLARAAAKPAPKPNLSFATREGVGFRDAEVTLVRRVSEDLEDWSWPAYEREPRP